MLLKELGSLVVKDCKQEEYLNNREGNWKSEHNSPVILHSKGIFNTHVSWMDCTLTIVVSFKIWNWDTEEESYHNAKGYQYLMDCTEGSF
jgi:hypothetical protein